MVGAFQVSDRGEILTPCFWGPCIQWTIQEVAEFSQKSFDSAYVWFLRILILGIGTLLGWCTVKNQGLRARGRFHDLPNRLITRAEGPIAWRGQKRDCYIGARLAMYKVRTES